MTHTEKRIRKQALRTLTRKLFKKRGVCELCHVTTQTTWHHKAYRARIRRKDLMELCRGCHDFVELDLKMKAMKGNKLKRELRRRI